MQKLSDDDNLNAMKSVHQSQLSNLVETWILIRPIQDDEVFDMWVGTLIICCKSNCAVTFSISFPSRLVLSWEYQFFDLAFKSPINTIRNGLFWHKVSKFNSKLSMNFLNLSWVWLGDLYKEMKLQILPPIFNLKLIHSWRYWIPRTHKAKTLL